LLSHQFRVFRYDDGIGEWQSHGGEMQYTHRQN